MKTMGRTEEQNLPLVVTTLTTACKGLLSNLWQINSTDLNKISHHVYINITQTTLETALRECTAHLRQAAILNFNYVTIQFVTCHLPLAVLCNRASISKGFQDICIQDYLGHRSDILGSRDVLGPWPLDTSGAISYRCSIVTKPLSLTIFEIFNPINVNEQINQQANEPTNITDCNIPPSGGNK